MSVTLIGHMMPNSPCTNRYWKPYLATAGSGASQSKHAAAMAHGVKLEVAEGDALHLAIGGMIANASSSRPKRSRASSTGGCLIGDTRQLVEPAAGELTQAREVRLEMRSASGARYSFTRSLKPRSSAWKFAASALCGHRTGRARHALTCWREARWQGLSSMAGPGSVVCPLARADSSRFHSAGRAGPKAEELPVVKPAAPPPLVPADGPLSETPNAIRWPSNSQPLRLAPLSPALQVRKHIPFWHRGLRCQR